MKLQILKMGNRLAKTVAETAKLRPGDDLELSGEG